MSSDQKLSKAALVLSQVAFREWGEFMTAMEEYTHTRINHIVSSPLEELQRNQGRAQSLSALLTLLAACRKAATKTKE